MNDKTNLKIALLIDADNISSTLLTNIIDEVNKYGIPTYKRIYGDWTSANMKSWKSAILNHAINPIQQFAYTSGKNATDSAMIIDAMDILYAEKVDGFFIASSDSDFTKLVSRLRESGKYVVGFGNKETPTSFKAVCDKFINSDFSITEKTKIKIDKEIINLILTSIDDLASDTGWVFLGLVGHQIQKKNPEFDVRSYGYKKLNVLIKDLQEVEIKEIGPSDGIKDFYVKRK